MEYALMVMEFLKLGLKDGKGIDEKGLDGEDITVFAFDDELGGLGKECRDFEFDKSKKFKKRHRKKNMDKKVSSICNRLNSSPAILIRDERKKKTLVEDWITLRFFDGFSSIYEFIDRMLSIKKNSELKRVLGFSDLYNEKIEEIFEEVLNCVADRLKKKIERIVDLKLHLKYGKADVFRWLCVDEILAQFDDITELNGYSDKIDQLKLYIKNS